MDRRKRIAFIFIFFTSNDLTFRAKEIIKGEKESKTLIARKNKNDILRCLYLYRNQKISFQYSVVATRKKKIGYEPKTLYLHCNVFLFVK